MPPYKPLVDRLLDLTSHEPMSGCWLFIGCVDDCGYGRMFRRKGTRFAHRISFELFRGPIPKNMELDHLCRVRCCVNPDHLEVVTHAENVRRGDGGSNTRNRTCCPRGHIYDVLRKRANGKPPYRSCKTCQRIYVQNRRKTGIGSYQPLPS